MQTILVWLPNILPGCCVVNVEKLMWGELMIHAGLYGRSRFVWLAEKPQRNPAPSRPQRPLDRRVPLGPLSADP